MIKLFISDLDGCIAHPFVSPDWKTITRIKELNNLSKNDPAIPPLTICSGRPLPFVEAVAQWLDVKFPMLFESGGGIYDLQENELSWNPHFDKEAREAVVEIKSWMEEHLINKFDGTIAEFTKFTDAGLINPEKSQIVLMHKEILNYVTKRYPRFEVHDTDVSVNVILKKTNKANGIRFLCNMLDLNLDEVAYIGDSSGDIEALKIVGKAYAPINAGSYVKESAGFVTAEATLGVLEAYENLIEFNKGVG
ncbi:MAG: HAD-IIB family hydrolase [Balneolaceae bacterium]